MAVERTWKRFERATAARAGIWIYFVHHDQEKRMMKSLFEWNCWRGRTSYGAGGLDGRNDT